MQEALLNNSVSNALDLYIRKHSIAKKHTKGNENDPRTVPNARTKNLSSKVYAFASKLIK